MKELLDPQVRLGPHSDVNQEKNELNTLHHRKTQARKEQHRDQIESIVRIMETMSINTNSFD